MIAAIDPHTYAAQTRCATSQVQPAGWRDRNEPPGTCRYFAGKLIVVHTVEGHEAIAATLAELRKGAGK